MPSSYQLLTWVRRQLKRLPLAVWAWRLLKKTTLDAPYNARRLLGHLIYPIISYRAPLLGYYDTTQQFLRHGDGYRIDLETPTYLTEKAARFGEVVPQIFVAVIARGRTLYDCGAVVSPDHRLLADISWHGYGPVSEPRSNPAMYNLQLPPIKYIAGKLAIISSVAADVYYHWMFDILPRFEILQKSGLVPDYYVVNANTPFQKESLHFIGIPSHQILSPTKSTYIEADELVVPSLPGAAYYASPTIQACDYLRSTFLQKDGEAKAAQGAIHNQSRRQRSPRPQ